MAVKTGNFITRGIKTAGKGGLIVGGVIAGLATLAGARGAKTFHPEQHPLDEIEPLPSVLQPEALMAQAPQPELLSGPVEGRGATEWRDRMRPGRAASENKGLENSSPAAVNPSMSVASADSIEDLNPASIPGFK